MKAEELSRRADAKMREISDTMKKMGMAGETSR